MPSKEQIAVVEMVRDLLLGKTEGVSKVTYQPQRIPFPEELPYEQPFLRAVPESQGISSRRLGQLLRELSDEKQLDMHHFLVLRHGKMICECGFAPYRRGVWHATYSMCKSITGMAIGLLVEEGLLSLEENIYHIFSDIVNPITKLFRPEITVKHLLTMSSGNQFNESGIVSGNNWLESYLSASVSGRPGEVFAYNSLNTYVLSAIVSRRAGMPMEEYLRSRLFAPMGITRYLWESCPKGITKGGWGLFLCPEDMAKLGQLYLQKGRWNGRQLIPEAWVELSTQKQIETDTVPGTFGYGYQIWMEERPGSFEFNGMLGQNVIVYPDLEMVLVTCAGNKELFQACRMLNIIRRYFPADLQLPETLPENPGDTLFFHNTIADLENGTTCLPVLRKRGWKSQRPNRKQKEPSSLACRKFLDQKSYTLEPACVGIFPLVLQVMHNHMTEGITKIRFLQEKGSFFVELKEGETWIRLEVGFGKAKESQVILQGETWLAATSGTFTRDENGTLVLKLEIAFLEEALSRVAAVFFEEEQIKIEWMETPGKKMILEGLKSLTEELENHILFVVLREHGDVNVLFRLMENTIEPIVYGRLEDQKEDLPAEEMLNHTEGGNEDDVSGNPG